MSPIRYTHIKLDRFELWGKEYPDGSWKLRVFADEDRKIETYESISPHFLPSGTRAGEAAAVRAAVDAWLLQDLQMSNVNSGPRPVNV
jgi:hypothetical protein